METQVKAGSGTAAMLSWHGTRQHFGLHKIYILDLVVDLDEQEKVEEEDDEEKEEEEEVNDDGDDDDDDDMMMTTIKKERDLYSSIIETIVD
ncbi:hypothetical protein ElyMa_003831000 [Elysia marginata]|uniref:Uncharacterized protein n=1 Tax=Elysia marginata TaxID=1093978 RepID=A0AAV4FFA6_9GAST|nr:hypothetical protein ElyMa_003831000 [Elysia marginata]